MNNINFNEISNQIYYLLYDSYNLMSYDDLTLNFIKYEIINVLKRHRIYYKNRLYGPWYTYHIKRIDVLERGSSLKIKILLYKNDIDIESIEIPF